ncbi:MAG: hypothetical protein ACFBRM_11080 [Pikeienuella sp.]
MKSRLMNGFQLAGMIAVGSATVALAGEEKVIPLTEVPAEIMEIAKANLVGLRLARDGAGPLDDGSEIDDNLVLVYDELGEVTLVSANTETEADGSFVYEIQGTVEGGRKIEIDIDPDGTVLEIEIEFTMEDVPGAVKLALEREYPGFVAEFIEASHSSTRKVVGYEFVGTSGETALDLEVSADGRTIIVADQ